MDVAYVIIICSAVFVINTYQSDDKDNANILVNSLPYTRKEIISSKYVGTLLFTIVIIPFCLVGKYFILDSMEFQLSIESYILGFLAVMLITAFYIPFFVAFKVKTLVPVFIFLSIGVIYLMKNTPYLLNKYANGVLTFFKRDFRFENISFICCHSSGVLWGFMDIIYSYLSEQGSLIASSKRRMV